MRNLCRCNKERQGIAPTEKMFKYTWDKMRRADIHNNNDKEEENKPLK